MRTFNEQLQYKGFSSLKDWFKATNKPFTLRLRTVYQDPNDRFDVTKQDRYWAVFTPWHNGEMVEIKFMLTEGLSEARILTFRKHDHVLNKDAMVVQKPIDAVDSEFSMGEESARNEIAKFMADKASWRKTHPGRNNPSYPHEIYKYLMRGDIAILESYGK